MPGAELTTAAPPPAVGRRDRLARISASAGFAVQGLSFAAVISQVVAFRNKFGLDGDQMTLVLATVPIIAGVGSVLAGVLAPRISSGPVLRISALGVAAMTAATGLARADQAPLFFAAVATFGLFLGAVDATMNMQGTAVQRRYGRSILASCHAWWSVAAIVGSAAALWAVNHSTQTIFLGAAGIAGALISIVAGPGLLKKAEEAEVPAIEAAEGIAPVVPRRRMLVFLIGIALSIMFVGDAATTNWSEFMLEDALHTSKSVVPAALFAYVVFQFLGRTVADHIIGAIGATKSVLLGSVVAAAGFVVVATAQEWPAAVAGFGAVGLGLSVVVPLTFSAADALDPAGTGKVIAVVNLYNYAGVIVGSVIIGVIAGAGHDPERLRLAFAVPAGLMLLIMLLAPAFRVVDRARVASAVAARDIAAR